MTSVGVVTTGIALVVGLARGMPFAAMLVILGGGFAILLGRFLGMLVDYVLGPSHSPMLDGQQVDAHNVDDTKAAIGSPPNLNDGAAPSLEQTPLCLHCFQSVSPIQHYCPHCGQSIGQLTPYLPYEGIWFQAGMWGKLWNRLWYRNVESDARKVFFFLLILLQAPILLLALPTVWWWKSKQHRQPTGAPHSANNT